MEIKANNKTYYTIENVASLIKVTPRTIKKWEQDGLLPSAQRHPLYNWRIYSKEDIKEIKKLVISGELYQRRNKLYSI